MLLLLTVLSIRSKEVANGGLYVTLVVSHSILKVRLCA